MLWRFNIICFLDIWNEGDVVSRSLNYEDHPPQPTLVNKAPIHTTPIITDTRPKFFKYYLNFTWVAVPGQSVELLKESFQWKPRIVSTLLIWQSLPLTVLLLLCVSEHNFFVTQKLPILCSPPWSLSSQINKLISLSSA